MDRIYFITNKGEQGFVNLMDFLPKEVEKITKIKFDEIPYKLVEERKR